MLKKLTIAIPTYNRNEYLVQLLDTIPLDFEGKVIVSDNGGYVTDEIKKKYNKYTFFCHKNKLEMFENWNFALSQVKTEYFIMPSDDDLFCCDSFTVIEQNITRERCGDIFIFGHNVIDENGNILSFWKPNELVINNKLDAFKVFLKGVDARCPSILFRTDMAKELGGFDESYKFTAADSLLIHKCLLYGHGVFVSEIISSYRVWPNNFTNQLISSKQWLNKISRWTNEIGIILDKDFSKDFSKNDIKNFRDEIYARNLVGGIVNKRKNQGRIAACNFAIKNRFPFHADFKTKLSIIATVFKS